MPKQSRETFCFTKFLLLLFLLPLLFLSAQILSGRVLSNHWKDCSEICRYGCEVVQGDFKIYTVELKGWPTGVPKTAEILSGLFLTNH